MEESIANTMTFMTGAVGGAVGFIVIGFIVFVLFVPLAHFLRSRVPAEDSGLARFAASLDKADVGYRDRLPQEPQNSTQMPREARTTRETPELANI